MLKVARIARWKSGRGAFVDFENYGFSCWMWAPVNLGVGKRYRVRTERQLFGNSAATHRIVEAIPEGEAQEKATDDMPRQKSALRDLAKMEGVKVQGGADSLPEYTRGIDCDVAILKQAQFRVYSLQLYTYYHFFQGRMPIKSVFEKQSL